MELKEHEARCRELFGKPFTEIHIFIDTYSDVDHHLCQSDEHRTFMHNWEGIQKVCEHFGTWAGLPAMAHILDDCKGYIPLKDDYLLGVVERSGVPRNPKLRNPIWYQNFLHWEVEKISLSP